MNGGNQTRLDLVCISDTHTAKILLPEGDILIHAGDLTYKGKTSEIKDQLDWLSSYKNYFKKI